MGRTQIKPDDIGTTIQTGEIDDNSVTDPKIAPQISTKITGLAPQTQPFLLGGNFINLSTIKLQQTDDQVVFTVPDEDLAGLKIQNNNGSVEITNATGAVGNFAPALIFNSGGDERAVGQIIAKLPALFDTGTEAAIRIAGRLDDNSVLINRPVVAFYNFNIKVSQIEADGTQNFLGNKLNLSSITLQEVSDRAVMTIADDTGGAGFKVQNTDGFIQLINGTGTVDAFGPTIQMRIGNAGKTSLIIGEVKAAEDTGSTSVIRLEARKDDITPLTTRPILVIANHATTVLEIAADGTVNFLGNTLTNVGVFESNSANLPVTGAIRLGNGELMAWRNSANNNNSFIRFNTFNQFAIEPDGIEEYTFDATEADFKNNNVKNLNELKWRNNANTADLILRVDASDQLIFDDGVISIPAGAKTEGPVNFLNNAETQFLILDTNAADQLTFEGNVIPNMKSGSISSIAEGSTLSVVFSTPFANTPKIIASFNENTDFTGSSISTTTVSNTGFTVRYDRTGSGPMTADISWIAVE